MNNKTVVVAVSMPEPMSDWLDEWAASDNMTRSEAVRRLLREKQKEVRGATKANT